MNFDLNILNFVMKLIIGITKIFSPILLKIPVLIIIGIGFVISYLGIGSMDFIKYLSKTKLFIAILIVIILLLMRGG